MKWVLLVLLNYSHVGAGLSSTFDDFTACNYAKEALRTTAGFSNDSLTTICVPAGMESVERKNPMLWRCALQGGCVSEGTK